LLPALLILGLTVFWPCTQAFYLSFTRYEYDLTPPQWWVLPIPAACGLTRFLANSAEHSAVSRWRRTDLVVTPLALAILVNQKLRGINGFGQPITRQS